MKFIHRLGYYLGGFSIGLIILAFFLSGKKTSCDYFPNARVLKSIRSKHQVYSEQAQEKMKMYRIDTSEISTILQKGDIDFGRSNTDLDSCNIYFITGQSQSHNLELTFENCDSIATLQKLEVIK